MKALAFTAVHGLLGSPSDWQKSFAADLGLQRATNNACLIDLNNYIVSEPDITSLAATLNRDIELRSDAKSIQIAFGYSLGGRVVLHQLLDRPNLFAAAILISPHLGLPKLADKFARIAHDAVWSEKLLQLASNNTTENRQAVLELWNSQPVFALPGSAPVSPSSDFNPRLNALMLERWGLGRQDFLYPRLHEIRCPVLWLVGEHDQKFRIIAAWAATQNDLIKVVVVENAGHRVARDNPQAFARETKAFLSNLVRDKRSAT